MNRPDRVAQLAERWVSIPKVVGLIPTVVRHIFQLAWCGYRLRIKAKTSGYNSVGLHACIGIKG